MFTQQYIDKLNKLYFEKYGVKLTNEETTRMAIDLVNLMRVLLKPDPKPMNK